MFGSIITNDYHNTFRQLRPNGRLQFQALQGCTAHTFRQLLPNARLRYLALQGCTASTQRQLLHNNPRFNYRHLNGAAN